MNLELKIEEVLAELDKPIFYTARDKDNNLYLVLLIDEHRELFTKVAVNDLIDMLENVITMQDIFIIHPENKVFYKEESDGGYEITESTCASINITHLPYDEYFGNLSEELFNYLNKLKTGGTENV